MTAITEPGANSSSQGRQYVLAFSCPDRPGIVFEVARFIFEHDGSILESQQFSDTVDGQFFMRVQFAHRSGQNMDVSQLRTDFSSLAATAMMSWRLTHADDKPRVLIMVSKFGHCMNDLLYRSSVGSLNMTVPAVVSNHPDLASLSDYFNVPFHHIPLTPFTRSAAEAELLELVDSLDIDLVVLARYMQVLSDSLCQKLEGRAINIHHSMLPSFKGATPYQQAYSRGVKLVGATAHYVTADLDEGPIIEQEVTRVDHSMSAGEVAALGRDNECLALSRAVRWHTENRVLLHAGRTVVFQ